MDPALAARRASTATRDSESRQSFSAQARLISGVHGREGHGTRSFVLDHYLSTSRSTPATMPRTVRSKPLFGTRMLSIGTRLLKMTQTPSRSIPFERFTDSAEVTSLATD